MEIDGEKSRSRVETDGEESSPGVEADNGESSPRVETDGGEIQSILEFLLERDGVHVCYTYISLIKVFYGVIDLICMVKLMHFTIKSHVYPIVEVLGISRQLTHGTVEYIYQ